MRVAASLAGSTIVSSLAARTRTAQSLSASAASRSDREARDAVLRERVDHGRTRDIARIAQSKLIRRRQRLRPGRRPQLAQARRRRRPHHRVVVLEMIEQNGARRSARQASPSPSAPARRHADRCRRASRSGAACRFAPAASPGSSRARRARATRDPDRGPTESSRTLPGRGPPSNAAPRREWTDRDRTACHPARR